MGVVDSGKEYSDDRDVELGVPLINATLIEETPMDPPPPSPPAKVRVKVTAPSTLPPGYVLQILYQEKDESGNSREVWKKAVVRVPVDGDGVDKGEVFEAETQPFYTVHQFRGAWLGSEFDPKVCCCSQATDTDFCLLSWCCAPVAWACLLEQLMDLEKQSVGKKQEYRPQFVAKGFGIVSLLFLVLVLVSNASSIATTESKGSGDSGSTMIFAVIFVAFAMFVRSKVRAHYSIKTDNCCYDCCCVTCFSSCSVLQAYHQMKKAHEHPHLGYLPNEPLPAEAEKLV